MPNVQCDECNGRTFVNERAYLNHLSSKLHELRPRKCPVEGCAKRLKDTIGLLQHVSGKHPSYWQCCEDRILDTFTVRDVAVLEAHQKTTAPGSVDTIDARAVAVAETTLGSEEESQGAGSRLPVDEDASLAELRTARPVLVDWDSEDEAISCATASSSSSVVRSFTGSDDFVNVSSTNKSDINTVGEGITSLADTMEDRHELRSLQSENITSPEPEDVHNTTASNTQRPVAQDSEPVQSTLDTPDHGAHSSFNSGGTTALQTVAWSTFVEVIPRCRSCMKASTTPITTTCGHIFCHGCMLAVMSKPETLYCPTCRLPIFIKLEVTAA